MSKKSSTFAPAFEKRYCRADARGPLAQLNRVSDYGSEGCRFESCMGHKKCSCQYGRSIFFVWKAVSLILCIRHNQRADDVCQQAGEGCRTNRQKHPTKTNQRGIPTKIFSYAATYAAQLLVFRLSKFLFHCCIFFVCSCHM